VDKFPNGYLDNKKVKMFCSNDYLNMAHHKQVIKTMQTTLETTGTGAGGTRNISGSNNYHKKLETTLGNLHSKDAILFKSCYTANSGFFNTIKKIIPDCTVFSDEKNHASMILGIKNANLNKVIFNHNCVNDLENKLKIMDYNKPKLLAFESIYSMSGNVAPIKKFTELATKYNCMTFVDEVHAIGMYGNGGRGIVNELELEDNIDVISGTLGKAYGIIGGYIAGNNSIIDCIRSYSPEFIFTTAPPPVTCAGAIESINILLGEEGDIKRSKMKHNISYLKNRLKSSNIPILETDSNKNTHIVCIIIGNPIKCKKMSDILLKDFNIYIQAINYPTVDKGKELLRITLSPMHTKSDIEYLVNSLKKIL